VTFVQFHSITSSITYDRTLIVENFVTHYVMCVLCACVFKSRHAVIAGIYDDYMVQ